MDLFVPVVDPSKFHPAYARVLAQENRFNEAVLEKWADGFEDRDGKFVKEFQTSFDSSFWELYLHAVLKELGCEVYFSHARPDFCVASPFEFSIEATVALHAQGGEPASAAYAPQIPIDLREFNRQAILRLANSISGKIRKYTESYSELDHVRGKPFVLAVAPFDRPGFGLQVNRAIEAFLFGHYVDESGGTLEELIRNGPDVFQMASVQKTLKAEVGMGIFLDDSHSHISAVIFSNCATWSKVSALSEDPNPSVVFNTIHYNPHDTRPLSSRHLRADHEEHLLDGLRIYHNPFANEPLEKDLFSDERIFQAYYDLDGEGWCYQASRKNLLFRTSMKFVSTQEYEAMERQLSGKI